jgi:hypothetical protein
MGCGVCGLKEGEQVQCLVLEEKIFSSKKNTLLMKTNIIAI